MKTERFYAVFLLSSIVLIVIVIFSSAVNVGPGLSELQLFINESEYCGYVISTPREQVKCDGQTYGVYRGIDFSWVADVCLPRSEREFTKEDFFGAMKKSIPNPESYLNRLKSAVTQPVKKFNTAEIKNKRAKHHRNVLF